MDKRYYRFFGPFLDSQEKWLNRMALKGYRLEDTGKLRYDFQACQPGSYIYRVEFVAQKPRSEVEQYKSFLQELGCRVFFKNINLNFSVGKVRYRPWAQPGARLATKATTFDRELLIVERESDGEPFELYSTNADKLKYYTAVRNAMLATGLLMLAGMAALLVSGPASLWGALAFGVLGAVPLVSALRCQSRVWRYRRNSEFQE